MSIRQVLEQQIAENLRQDIRKEHRAKMRGHFNALRIYDRIFLRKFYSIVFEKRSHEKMHEEHLELDDAREKLGVNKSIVSATPGKAPGRL